jgi:hypothetical protein
MRLTTLLKLPSHLWIHPVTSCHEHLLTLFNVAVIMRSETKVFLGGDSNPPVDAPNATQILCVQVDSGQFYIQPNEKDPLNVKNETAPQTASAPSNSEANDNSVWIVVKSLQVQGQTKGYVLSEGDLIKLGRIRFRVKTLKTEKNKPGSSALVVPSQDETAVQGLPRDGGSKKALNAANKSVDGDKDNSSVRSVITCRICLGEGGEEDNPFISPCQCAGTMKYVHVKCLQYWLSSKLTTKQGAAITSIVWKSFECELCKKAFPPVFHAGGKKYDAIEIPTPTSHSFIIFELLSKERNQAKGYHIIDLSIKPNIKMVNHAAFAFG